MPIVPDRYLFATRLNSFRDRGVVDRGAAAPDLVRAAAGIPGLAAVELNYPQHLQGTTEAALSQALAETGLALTALGTGAGRFLGGLAQGDRRAPVGVAIGDGDAASHLVRTSAQGAAPRRT